MLLYVLVFLRFEGAILKDKTLDFFLVGVADLEKKVQERERRRGRNDLLILGPSFDGKVMLDEVIGCFLRNSINQGRQNGNSGSLFILLDRSCRSIFDLIFGLTRHHSDLVVTWLVMGAFGGYPLRWVGLLDFVMVVGG